MTGSQAITLAAGCSLEALEEGVNHEFVAFDGREPEGLPRAPGEAARTGEGGWLLHFAPRRWLLAGDCGAVATQLAAATAEGTLVEVEGKWRAFGLRGAAATRLLASALEMESLLTGRDCAMTSFVDCPLLVVRATGSLRLWTHASYVEDLIERLRNLRVG